MQEDGEVRLPDDDMVDGDLGDGMMKEACARRRIHQSFCLSENLLLRTQLLTGDLLGIPGLKTSHTHQVPGRNIPHLSSITEMSKEDLTVRLQEAAEVIDLLCCELDVTYRYLEGKYEALKILQGKAILEKATIHTKSLLQKSEDKAKALEKEVNSLQWELSFLQLQMKTSEQSWEQKHSRMLSENKALTESLEETESELQQLRAQNAALRREYLELLSLLSVRDQVLYQKTKPPYSPESDAHVLELAVLGACQCLGVNEVCPCSRNAAASRKQVVLLHQELDAQHSRREEALMVADAFRIAFEQQLKKRSEHLLLLAETSVYKAEGGSRSPLISVRQKLRSLLPSSVDVKRPEELLETLYKLMDLGIAASWEKYQRSLHFHLQRVWCLPGGAHTGIFPIAGGVNRLTRLLRLCTGECAPCGASARLLSRYGDNALNEAMQRAGAQSSGLPRHEHKHSTSACLQNN
ncbi:coiled-coil domain-containing protein 125-like [Gouania willdenowi]|uniref:Coiled-coil domain-containing protein 125-like n=2 Tax=Gouania willdenowi TaxID=441366 RepID=A0A8C5EPB0_GOUWI|nr:coiled-coil domain-containing protein 125-like [Gouania willdenowi]